MRLILAAAATAVAAAAIFPTAAYTQATNPNSATKASLNDSYNRCVALARSRGYTSSDLDDNRAAARNFVLRCMQGKQR